MRIKTLLNKSKGIEVSVHMLKNGKYKVVMYDIDDMRYLPEMHDFLDRRVAMTYAENLIA